MEASKKTRNKTFRLDIELIARLDKAAKRAGVTESLFVTHALQERLIIDPLIPAFPLVSLSAETLRLILSLVNEQSLADAGSELARRNCTFVRELYAANGVTLDLGKFLIDVLGKHANWFCVEGDFRGSSKRMILRHPYGPAWSTFLAAYIHNLSCMDLECVQEVEEAAQFVKVLFR